MDPSGNLWSLIKFNEPWDNREGESLLGELSNKFCSDVIRDDRVVSEQGLGYSQDRTLLFEDRSRSVVRI